MKMGVYWFGFGWVVGRVFGGGVFWVFVEVVVD